MATRKTKNTDDDFALDLTGAVQHVAFRVNREAQSIDDLTAGYTHGNTGDLARVKTHQNLATDTEAVTWLVQRAVDELKRVGKRGKIQLIEEEGWVFLAPGVAAEELKWRGSVVHAPVDIHSVLGDPFNAMSGKWAGNVRKNTGKDDLSELKESMRAVGWLPGHPAVKDARTRVTITGHRRLQVAAELRAEGVEVEDDVLFVNFELNGEGDPADVHRTDTALLSNWGFRVPTPEERQETALWLSEKRGMSQQEIATVLGVSQQTVSRDLKKIVTQMSNAGELEPLIAAAMSGIRRELTMAAVGREQGLKHDSLPLAKAYAVATDRLRRELGLPAAEPAQKLPADDVRTFGELTEPETTAEHVHEAIREVEEEIANGKEQLTTLEDLVSQTGPDIEDWNSPEDAVYDESVRDEPKWPLTNPRPAVQPPANLPPAPVRSEDDDRYPRSNPDRDAPAHDLAYYQMQAEQLARLLDPLGEYPQAVQQLRNMMENCWDDAIKSWQMQTTPYGT